MPGGPQTLLKHSAINQRTGVEADRIHAGSPLMACMLLLQRRKRIFSAFWRSLNRQSSEIRSSGMPHQQYRHSSA